MTNPWHREGKELAQSLTARAKIQPRSWDLKSVLCYVTLSITYLSIPKHTISALSQSCHYTVCILVQYAFVLSILYLWDSSTFLQVTLAHSFSLLVITSWGEIQNYPFSYQWTLWCFQNVLQTSLLWTFLHASCAHALFLSRRCAYEERCWIKGHAYLETYHMLPNCSQRGLY